MGLLKAENAPESVWLKRSPRLLIRNMGATSKGSGGERREGKRRKRRGVKREPHFLFKFTPLML